MPFALLDDKDLECLVFQLSGFERTWWRLIQKHVVLTKLDFYFFISIDVLKLIKINNMFFFICLNGQHILVCTVIMIKQLG
jgi:hypothetical protein